MLNVCSTNNSPFSIQFPQYVFLLSIYSVLGASWGAGKESSRSASPTPEPSQPDKQLVTSAQYSPDFVLFLHSYGVILTNQ